jgi:hypothetical protein
MIIKLITESLEQTIDLMERFEICSRSDAEAMRFRLEMDKVANMMSSAINS